MPDLLKTAKSSFELGVCFANSTQFSEAELHWFKANFIRAGFAAGCVCCTNSTHFVKTELYLVKNCTNGVFYFASQNVLQNHIGILLIVKVKIKLPHCSYREKNYLYPSREASVKSALAALVFPAMR